MKKVFVSFGWCCVWLFPSVVSGASLVDVRELLTAVASLVSEHGPQAHGLQHRLSSCRAWA